MNATDKGMTFVDVFAGCGGLSLGLLRAGWSGLLALEKDAFAFDTLRANLINEGARYRYAWPDWLEQKPWAIEEFIATHGHRLQALRGKVDLLAGGPPCQGFSSAGRRRRSDPRNKLVERYMEFVDILLPRMVLIENVRGMTYDFIDRRGDGCRRNFASELIARLGVHYYIYTDTLRCSMFGVPQERPRFFLVGILRSASTQHSASDNPFSRLLKAREDFLDHRGIGTRVTAKQAISDLEVARSGTTACLDSRGYEAIATRPPRTSYQRLLRDGFAGSVSDTRLAKHRPHIVARFQRIVEECWQAGRLHVQLNREMRNRYGIKKMATRVLDPNQPAPTITSMPDDLLHYSEPRTLTVRENARLQTFPDWFCFKGKYTTGGDRRAREVPRFTQVANAVPPLIAEMWGEVLMKYTFESAASDRRAA